MKRLILAVVAVLASTTMMFAQGNKDMRVFNASSSKLESYLALTSDQVVKVDRINNYFVKMQKAITTMDPAKRNANFHNLVASNLLLMKKTLEPAQYNKYARLLSISIDNQMFEDSRAINGNQLAEK